MDSIIALIKRENPDILFMQEVFNSHNKSLERRFRTVDVFKKEFEDSLFYSDFKGIAYDPDIEGDMGNAIFTRFQILENASYFFDVPYGEVHFTGEHDPLWVPRSLQYVKINADGVVLNLYNLHGVWGEDGADNPRRDNMAKVIIENVKGQENVIIAGDTNLNPDTKFVKRIEDDLNLESVFKTSLVSTFNMLHKTNPGYATAAVDMIFASKNFRVIEKYMPMDDVSDHRPLVATLEL